jgi:hypothetical protein
MRACARGCIFSLVPTLRARTRKALAPLSALLIARSPNHAQGARLRDSEHLL